MIKRSVSELHFINGRDPLPTIEIRADSLEAQGLYLGQIVSSELTRYAANNPASTATIYTYSTISVNFHEEGWSEFIIVAGDKKVLKALNSAFSSLPRIKSRYSDYIAPSEGTRAFHVEDGLLWEPEDAVTWYSASPENAENDQDSVDKTAASDEDIEDDDNVLGDVIEDSELELESGENKSDAHTGSRVEEPGRYRAARSDAKIAGICQTIEQLFGLPEGSVALCGPDGRALKGNAFIKTLRRRWEDA
jgi:hypothetical protein